MGSLESNLSCFLDLGRNKNNDQKSAVNQAIQIVTKSIFGLWSSQRPPARSGVKNDYVKEFFIS